MSTADLIFDIGMHKGEDSSFYLAKGFRVVAVEANPVLVAAAQEKFAEQIESGALSIVHAALTSKGDEDVTLYVNDGWTDWSSLTQSLAERDGTAARAVVVRSTTLFDVVARFGVPYYMKCDIEGADATCAAQLLGLERKPAFASFEMSDLDIFASLRCAGYARFQFVNQTLNWARKQPEHTKEGKAVEWTFAGDCSGPFGRDLPENKWVDFRTALRRFLAYEDLRVTDSELGLGWMDVHAWRD